MNIKQNKQLHLLLSQTGLLPQKADLVAGFTNGRTEHSSEMTTVEVIDLIKYLKAQKKGEIQAEKRIGKEEKMRRKIIAIAHQMGWKKQGKADMERINNWCLQQFGKKPLNGYTLKELTKLISIFENKVYKQFLQGI
jgi:hypothetical protein